MPPAYKNKLGTQKVLNRVGNTVLGLDNITCTIKIILLSRTTYSPHSFLPGNWTRSHTHARQILYHWVRFLVPGFLRWDLIMEHSSLTSKSPCHPGLSWTTILLLIAWLKVCIIISNYRSPLKQQLHLGHCSTQICNNWLSWVIMLTEYDWRVSLMSFPTMIQMNQTIQWYI